jgi:hypothetical protein
MCVELFHAPRTPELVEFGLHEEAGGFLLDSVSAVVINMSPYSLCFADLRRTEGLVLGLLG